MVDHRGLQERQPPHDPGDLGSGAEACPGSALRQEALCGGRLLRRQQGHPHGHPLHHGGGLAGSLRAQHVHQAHRGRAEGLRARLRSVHRLQGQVRKLQGAGSEQRDRGGLQRHQPGAGHHQHLVRRRDEEGHVLHDELLPASQGYGRHALLRQHRHERREHRHLLRPLRHRQDYPVHRSQAPADRRRRARLGR